MFGGGRGRGGVEQRAHHHVNRRIYMEGLGTFEFVPRSYVSLLLFKSMSRSIS